MTGKVAGVIAALALAAGAIATAQQRPPVGDADAIGLEVLQIRPTVYMIAGAGANVTVQFGPDGAVVVDAGTLQNADAVVAAVKKLTGQPIRYVIDTSADPDHVGGNEKVSKAGKTLFQTQQPTRPGDDQRRRRGDPVGRRKC